MEKSEMQVAFETRLFEMYPDVGISKTVSRAQIVSTMQALGTTKYPTWIMENKVSRGLYAVGNTVVKEPMVEVKPSVLTTSLIPAKDKNYVAFGNHKDVELIVKSGLFYPTYITGPTGNGKSTMVEQVCASSKKSLIRVNLNMMTDEDQLIGSKTLVDGNVEVVEGPVLIAMRTGSTLLLDEIDAGSANTLL